MQFGNLAGLVNGTEQVIFNYEVTGVAVSSIPTGNILNGDEDGWYTVIICANNTTGAIYLRPNNDNGSYGNRGISSSGSTTLDYNSTNAGAFYVGNGNCISIARIYAKSGTVRLCQNIKTQNISGTTIDTLSLMEHVWNNTVDNITSLVLSGSLGVGTRFIVLKANGFANGTPTGVITTPYIKGAFTRLSTVSSGGNDAYFDFLSLDGDRDVLYYISILAVGGGSAVGASIVLNSDTGANYGRQRLGANNTTVSSFQGTGESNFTPDLSACTGITRYGIFLFAKQGYIRTFLAEKSDWTTSKTVQEIVYLAGVYSVTNTNITSIRVNELIGNNFKTGSYAELYALRPNG